MHVVVIGGGSGLWQTIAAVRPVATRLSVIVPTCANSGADALIRRLGPFPGLATAVEVMLQYSGDAAVQRLMQQQFVPLGTPYDRIPFAVLQLIAMAQSTGVLADTLDAMRQQLRCDIDVLMASEHPHDIVAHTSDDHTYVGASALAQPLSAPVQQLTLDPVVVAPPHTLKVLRVADLVVIAPGNLYRSVLPALMPVGIGETLRTLTGRVACCGALTTIAGHTDAFRAVDYVARIARTIGRGAIDVALLNSNDYTAVETAMLKHQDMAPLVYSNADQHVLTALDIAVIVRDMLEPLPADASARSVAELTRHHTPELRMACMQVYKHD